MAKKLGRPCGPKRKAFSTRLKVKPPYRTRIKEMAWRKRMTISEYIESLVDRDWDERSDA